ncbi:MAG TPA: TIGR03564 family F420-dependent LLM class oxidoreductase [Dehalococcoidia bacterium]|nr:TIGR03564 family F420-dependent LLM class oxidoreductase [Dehalococcoidia bacterium]
MRLGVNIAAGGPISDFETIVQRVIDAERDGFDSVWFNSGAAGEPLTAIAVAGRETSRIRLMTAIAVTYTRHPYLMAQQALTANAACRGRLILGVGPSHRASMERLGVSYEGAAANVREYVTVLRGLMRGDAQQFQGRFYRVEGQLQLPWAAPCPVVIAALAPRMLRTAGELADGTVTWMVGRRTLETHIRPRLLEAAAAGGRPQPEIYVGLPVAVTDDAKAARERANQSFANYADLPVYKRMLDIEGTDPGGILVCGNEAEVEAQLRSFAAAGASEIGVTPFPVGDNPAASVARTRELLKGLVGKL